MAITAAMTTAEMPKSSNHKITAMTAVPLFDYQQWDPAVAASAGIDVSALPRVVPGDRPAATVTPDLVPDSQGEVALGGGIVDAFAEQLVAGADRSGDVLVILGATLIGWAVIDEWVEADGLWTIPHTAPGKTLIGGPSNAGGLFVDWVRRLVGDPEPTADPARVPVFTPYVRGERVPLHDPDRRAGLADLDLTHGPPAVMRAAFEAGGFVIRHLLDLAGIGRNLGQPVRELDLDLDVLGQGSGQQLGHLDHMIVDLDRLTLALGFPAQGQELPGQLAQGGGLRPASRGDWPSRRGLGLLTARRATPTAWGQESRSFSKVLA